jgi:UDP-sugar transporter A1/2/3
MNLAFTGLLVSWIMKFADTIVKVYSTSMAMLVTMLISAWLFNVQPNLQVRLVFTLRFPASLVYCVRR